MKSCRFLVCTVLWSLFVSNCIAQRSKAEYLTVVERFYNLLESTIPVTVGDSRKVLGAAPVAEMEEYLFYDNCKNQGLSEKECGQSFDKYYYNQSTPFSLYFLKIQQQRRELTQGLTLQTILLRLQAHSQLFETGGTGCVVLKVDFSNGNYVYFSISKWLDEPITIGEVFLPDGRSLVNRIYPEHNTFLELPGKIVDGDGFVNIRRDPSPKAPIIGAIKQGEHFFYTPTNKSTWWKVMDAQSNFKGYVFYDRIILDAKTID